MIHSSFAESAGCINDPPPQRGGAVYSLPQTWGGLKWCYKLLHEVRQKSPPKSLNVINF